MDAWIKNGQKKQNHCVGLENSILFQEKLCWKLNNCLRHRVQPTLQLKNDYKTFVVNLVKDVI